VHQQQNKSGPHRWQKGVSGNPKGRPVASRQKLAEGLITDLAELWAEGGAKVLRHLMSEEPAKFAQLAFGILPKEALISIEERPPANLAPEAWSQLRRVLDIIESCAPAGAEPTQIFETIERALVAAYAEQPKQIEHQPAITMEIEPAAEPVPITIAPPPY
jgi:hypothetical protein